MGTVYAETTLKNGLDVGKAREGQGTGNPAGDGHGNGGYQGPINEATCQMKWCA